ncbi:MAG: hypothetical protein BIFFINMI_02838 [Phycisphaerae bacterium]|nr:hypothetical protein [Phycisphaerae bacterium]
MHPITFQSVSTPRGRRTRPMRPAIAACAILCVAACAAAAAPAPADKETLADKAAKVFKDALSQMHVRQWQQANDLFDQMIARYGTNENIPDARLYKAVCLRAQNLDDDANKLLEDISRLYAGTEAEMLADIGRMSFYVSKKDADNFLTVVKEMTGPTGAKALDHFMLDPRSYYYRENLAGPFQYYARDTLDLFQNLAKANKDTAEQIVTLLAATFKKGPGYLPAQWHWGHCELLYRAGRDDEADKAFAAYDKYWGDDLDCCRLWWSKSQYLEELKQADKAQEIYATIMKRWEGTTDNGAGEAGYRVATFLAAKPDGAKDLVAMADPFVKRYASTQWGTSVRGLLIKRAMELAPKDAEMCKRAFEMLDEDARDCTPPEKAAKLEQMIELAMTVNQPDRAVALFNGLLDPAMWSTDIYNDARKLAAKYGVLKPGLDLAVKRYMIPAPDPNGEAAKLAARLDGRIKDGQMRFAEEDATEMFTKHTEAAETIEAVARMCEYYFSQVMPKERDAWMDRMIATYNSHPRTEDVIDKRCTADNAEANYDKLATDTDLALRRFSSSHLRRRWVDLRVKAFEAAKDAQGKYDLMLAELGPAARRGHLYSLQLIMQALPAKEGEDRYVTLGKGWMNWADLAGDTHLGLYCLAQARACFENARDWDQAQAVSKRLREQKINPSLAQAYQFDDIYLFLQSKENDKAVAAAGRLTGEPRPRWSGYRERGFLPQLGSAFGELKKVSQGKALGDRLLAMYDWHWDLDAADSMLASMFATADGPSKPTSRAVPYLMDIVKRTNPPDLAYRTLLAAAYHAGADDKYDDTLNEYLRLIPRAHFLRPDLLQRLGEHYLARRDRRALTMQTTLNGAYPASKPRDLLNDRIEKARERARKQ